MTSIESLRTQLQSHSRQIKLHQNDKVFSADEDEDVGGKIFHVTINEFSNTHRWTIFGAQAINKYTDKHWMCKRTLIIIYDVCVYLSRSWDVLFVHTYGACSLFVCLNAKRKQNSAFFFCCFDFSTVSPLYVSVCESHLCSCRLRQENRSEKKTKPNHSTFT